MLKHLKMKAAMSQDRPPDLCDGDTLSSQDTEMLEQLNKDEQSSNRNTQENLIHSTTLSCTKEPGSAGSSCETDPKDSTTTCHGTVSGRTVTSICHAQTSTSHSADHFVHEVCHMKQKSPLHGSNTHAVHNAFQLTCQDPNCHCSPTKLITRHSPNMEGNCSCFSCLHQANVQRMVHHNSSIPYLHPSHVVETSPHHHLPGSGVFCSPQHSYHPQKPFFQSPYDHSLYDWGRLAGTAYSAPNINPAFNSPFHTYPPQKLPSPLWSSPSQQGYRSVGNQGLTLPLTRSSIVSLLKRGKCDVILHVLDGPLHDESSPLYPTALRTVLEILDVVEKEFANAYRSDVKIKADIHQLTNFVKGMTTATDSPNMEENVAQTGAEVNSKSLIRETHGEVFSTKKTSESSAVKEDAKMLVFESTEVNDGAPSKSPSDNAVQAKIKKINENANDSANVEEVSTLSLPIKTKEINKNATNCATGEVRNNKAEEIQSDRASAGESSSSNISYDSVVIFKGNDVKNISLKEDPEEEKNCENVCLKEGKDKGTSPGISSKNSNDDEWNASESATTSGATESRECDHVENVDGLHKEKADAQMVETGGHLTVSNSKESSQTTPVIGSDLKVQKLSSVAESNDEIDKPLDSDIDALLDQTLMEANQAKLKVAHEIASSTSLEDPSRSGPSDYRGKGYKIRTVSNSDKQITKAKAPVKTFAQIREKHAPLISESKSDCDLKEKSDPKNMSGADPLTKPMKDLNGNIVKVTETPTEVDKSEEPPDVSTSIAPRENTPELGRCPSNPLSPSCSDSLDSADFKVFVEKSKGRTSVGSVPDENIDANGGFSKSSSSALALLDQMKKLPLPKEPVRQGGSGKPLISKSFHGKLLLQKHSKEDPHPIPLEITDSDFIPRDPRLSLSNLMERKVNYEFGILNWETDQSASEKLPPKTEVPLNQSAINVRDPRIRRRLSDDASFSFLTGTAPCVGGLGVLSPNFLKVKNVNTPEEKGPFSHSVDQSSMKENKTNVLETDNPSNMPTGVTPPDSSPKGDVSSVLGGKKLFGKSVQFDSARTEGSSLKEVQNCVKENATLSEVRTSVSANASGESDCNQGEQNVIADSFDHEQDLLKSAIHSIRKTGDVAQLKKKEIPEIASTVSSCNISEIDKMDTVVSFRETLDDLKEIKKELKKDLERCGSKIETLGKDISATLSSKLKLLRQTCEIGLLSTEVQKKKASGKRFRDLGGLLEDHFILIADLTVLSVWLKTANSDISDFREGLPEFRKGVFTRRTVPCFKKLEKWLSNRYKLDGFDNDKLLKLVSMISKSGDGKRSRSRSSSTGSGKHKRRKARIDSHDGKEKKPFKKSDHSRDLSDCHKKSGVDSPAEKQRKRTHSPDRKVGAASSKKSKETPVVAATPDSDTSSEIPEQSPSTKSGSSTPGSETENLTSQVVGEKAAKQDAHEHVDVNSHKQKERKPEGSSQRKQSVSVNSGIQDIQEDMERIKKSSLNVFRKRSASSANRCLEELTEVSHKAHTQLDDENKTYTSLKNVSNETKAKFRDVIKGIQKIIVDCEILVYALSSNATKVAARETKDKIWQNAQKSSHKPSYEEELTLLLSLRKTYLNSDLWKYIKLDVDERIGSLQKKCRSRDGGSQRSTSSSMDYTSVERPTSWMNPNEQIIKESRLETPLAIPDYEMRSDIAFHGPGAPLNIDYHGTYLTTSDRNNIMEFPNEVFSPPNNRSFVRDSYHPNGTGVPREPYQTMTSFLPRDDYMKYDRRRRYDDDFDTWGIARRNPFNAEIDYVGRYFTPPPAI